MVELALRGSQWGSRIDGVSEGMTEIKERIGEIES